MPDSVIARPVRLLLLLLLAGGFAGWWLARKSRVPIISATAAQPFESSTATRAGLPATSTPVRPSEQDTTGTDFNTLANRFALALREESAETRDQALRTLLPRLVALDPGATARLALGWEPGLMRTELLRQLATYWSREDISGALTWLITVPDATDRSLVALAATASVAQADPAGAAELGLWLGAGTDDGSLERSVQLWTEEHPDEAVAWVLRQPAGPERDRLVARIAHVRSQQNPVEAARLVLAQLPAGATRDDALVNVVANWAARDAGEAAAWVASFSPGPLQTRALAEVERARRLH